MNKNKIQDLAFVDPSGKNLSKIRTLVNDVLNIIFKKLTNAEKSTPLPTSKWNDDGHFNDLPVSEKKILEKITQSENM